MRANRVIKVPMASPEDTAAVAAALGADGIDPTATCAVMCMTEGDGYARGYATLAFAAFFHEAAGWPMAEVSRRIPLVMIGGCSGLVSPYAAVFVDDPKFGWTEVGHTPSLAIGVTTTPPIPPEVVGTVAMVDIVASAVTDAMRQATIAPDEVHNVQVKTPWPLPSADDGRDVGTVGALARGAAALGVAVATGEVDRADITPAVLSSAELRSTVASVSAGTERSDAAVLVLGNSPCSTSPYRIGHGVMVDGLDVAGVRAALRSAGVDVIGELPPGEGNPVEHVFLKSGVDGTDVCRGRRHVLRTDYLAPYSWLLGKAVIHATVAAIVGDPMMQVSGGAEHQGPPGGGTLAVIVR